MLFLSPLIEWTGPLISNVLYCGVRRNQERSIVPTVLRQELASHHDFSMLTTAVLEAAGLIVLLKSTCSYLGSPGSMGEFNERSAFCLLFLH